MPDKSFQVTKQMPRLTKPKNSDAAKRVTEPSLSEPSQTTMPSRGALAY